MRSPDRTIWRTTGQPLTGCLFLFGSIQTDGAAEQTPMAQGRAGIITAVEVQSRNPRRVNVFLDGVFALAVSIDVATQAGLKRGIALTDEQASSLQDDDERQKTYDATLNFLAYRPRSEDEIRRYLARRKTTPDITQRIVDRLKASGLVDDAAFARYWVENRDVFSPRSSRALRSELRSKGIDSSTIEQAVSGDDTEAAYRAAQKKTRSVAGTDRETFRRKLIPFLQRRGFGYETAREAVDRLWKQQAEGDPGVDRDGE
jgi:regulatory protein